MVHIIRLRRPGVPDRYVKDEWSTTEDINHARIAINDSSVTALIRRWVRLNASGNFTWCHPETSVEAVGVNIIPV